MNRRGAARSCRPLNAEKIESFDNCDDSNAKGPAETIRQRVLIFRRLFSPGNGYVE